MPKPTSKLKHKFYDVTLIGTNHIPTQRRGKMSNLTKSLFTRSLVSAAAIMFFNCTSRDMNDDRNLKKSSASSDNNSSAKYPDASSKFLSACGSKMTQAQYRELLETSDISTFANYEDAAARATRIAEIFSDAKDRRGIFASMYVAITKESVRSSKEGEYADSVKASQLVKRFAERYFEPLHNHLLNGSNVASIEGAKKYPVVEEWRDYYAVAEKCDTSDLRILGIGVNNHMSMDLPYALSEIGAPESFKADFMKFGNILIQKKRESTDLLVSQQNVYAAAFFDLFIVGKVIDGFLPKGTAATWGFQLIRAEAWQNGKTLQNKELEKATWLGIRAAWTARQAILALMPKSNPKMKGTEE